MQIISPPLSSLLFLSLLTSTTIFPTNASEPKHPSHSTTTTTSTRISIPDRTHPARTPRGIRSLYICPRHLPCLHPETTDGTIHLLALVAARGPQHFSLSAVHLVHALPNAGASNGMLPMNAEDWEGAAVLMDRGGGVSIADKVLQAQACGAEAVVVVDDGRCGEDWGMSLDSKSSSQSYLHSCGGRMDLQTVGFATLDHWSTWAKVTIPCVLVSKEGGRRIREVVMKGDLEVVEIEGLGRQFVHVEPEWELEFDLGLDSDYDQDASLYHDEL